MYSIKLSGLHFHAPVGIYPEEQILGNKIEINLCLKRATPLSSPPLLDYEKIYQIVASEVPKPETLLENLMQRIIAAVQQLYPQTKLTIEIRKWHPAFGGDSNYAAVLWEDESY